MFRIAMALAVVAVTAIVWVVGAAPNTGANPNVGKIRHVVVFKFKETATKEQIETVEKAFVALPSKIPQIREFEWGTNISPENLAQGYTHCFLLTFDDEKGRDEYLPHPAHKEFGKSLGGVLEKAFVIDYKAR